MASRGIEDFGEGLGEYLQQAQEFHQSKGELFHQYVVRKVKAKGRKYNTIQNNSSKPTTSSPYNQQSEEPKGGE